MYGFYNMPHMVEDLSAADEEARDVLAHVVLSHVPVVNYDFVAEAYIRWPRHKTCNCCIT